MSSSPGMRSNRSLGRMDTIPLPDGMWLLFGVLVFFSLVLALAWEGLVLSTGALLVVSLSAGRIRAGERRNLWKRPPKLNGGQVFYFEDSKCYIYQNYLPLIGLVFWLLCLFAILGFGLFTNAPRAPH